MFYTYPLKKNMHKGLEIEKKIGEKTFKIIFKKYSKAESMACLVWVRQVQVQKMRLKK